MALSILLLTGQSGSGKSTAIRALEDAGYYCIDNLPTALVPQTVDVLAAEGAVERVALVMDIRDRRFVQEGPRLVQKLAAGPHALRVVYLDAKEEALLRRYSETRRRHPLDHGAGLRSAIAHEREVLTPLRELANETIDTTAMSPHELKARIQSQVAAASTEPMRVSLVSFGFKHGVPLESDLVLDVRFLPNPFFEPGMRERTGLDEDVSRYAIATPSGEEFLDKTEAYLRFLVPQYQREGKRYLTIAVGCTGGQHRSVAVCRALATRLGGSMAVDLRHRDMRPPPAASGDKS